MLNKKELIKILDRHIFSSEYDISRVSSNAKLKDKIVEDILNLQKG